MPRTETRTTHVRSRFSRCLFTGAVAVLLLLSLHGSSIAGTVRQSVTDHTNTAELTRRDMPPSLPLRSSLGTFAVPKGRTPIVSLQAACRSEVKLYCSGLTSSPLRCLVERFYREQQLGSTSVFSDVCEAWLTARDACLSFVLTHGAELCGAAAAAADARECLRQIPAAFLPPKCVSSDYYEGVRLVGKLRQRQIANARLRRIREQ